MRGRRKIRIDTDRAVASNFARTQTRSCAPADRDHLAIVASLSLSLSLSLCLFLSFSPFLSRLRYSGFVSAASSDAESHESGERPLLKIPQDSSGDNNDPRGANNRLLLARTPMSPRNGERSERRRAFRAKPVISRPVPRRCAQQSRTRGEITRELDSGQFAAFARAAISAFERSFQRAFTAAPRFPARRCAGGKERKKRKKARRERFRVGTSGIIPAAVVQRDELPRRAEERQPPGNGSKRTGRCDPRRGEVTRSSLVTEQRARGSLAHLETIGISCFSREGG